VKWYRLAAEQGHAKAQNNLGVAYAFGSGVPEDTVIAYAWANLAGANGSDVTKFKELIEQSMSPENISEAQKLTRQMMKDFPDVY
jgi:TPR repeat protein